MKVLKNDKSIYKCPECPKSFEKPSKFKIHSLGHVSFKLFYCTYLNCNKEYTRGDHLRRHMAIIHLNNLNQEKLTCTICNISFSYKHGLKRHMKDYHTNNDITYPCLTCNKEFKKKHLLMEHQYEHTTIMHFACNYCDKRYIKKQQLNGHIKVR
jgi:uncharacterized Zn-finger protein